MTATTPETFMGTLEHWASLNGAAEAVVDSQTRLSYRGLVDTVQEQAAALTASGVQHGDRVAVVAENTTAYLVTAFAVWQAGGVLATIYPSTGERDLTYALTNSDPVLVVTDQAKVAAVRAAAPADLPVTVHGQFTVPVSTAAERTPGSLRDELALICYTSGSSSHPKAVMHSADAIYRGALVYAQVWHLGPADRTIVCLPMAWAYGLITTSMATLIGGGTVLPVRRAHPDQLLAAIVDQRATYLPGVTTIFAKLVEHLRGLPDRLDLSSLRLCVSGGEPRNEQVFAEWTNRTGCPVLDVYSATESFPAITYDPFTDPVPVPGSAGKLAPGVQMKLLDPQGREVPAGEAGEAFWKSPAMMLGYWKDEEQTRAALTPDGWYRTKDLVRLDEHGYAFVAGRLSDMIIRGGSNVSPGEVEKVLREHPSVVDAAVIGLPDATYGQQVVAAVVAADPDAFSDSDVTAFGRTLLAAYKVPTRFVLVDQLPLNTTTGKLDRRRVAAELAGLESLT